MQSPHNSWGDSSPSHDNALAAFSSELSFVTATTVISGIRPWTCLVQLAQPALFVFCALDTCHETHTLKMWKCCRRGFQYLLACHRLMQREFRGSLERHTLFISIWSAVWPSQLTTGPELCGSATLSPGIWPRWLCWAQMMHQPLPPSSSLPGNSHPPAHHHWGLWEHGNCGWAVLAHAGCVMFSLIFLRRQPHSRLCNRCETLEVHRTKCGMTAAQGLKSLDDRDQCYF